MGETLAQSGKRNWFPVVLSIATPVAYLLIMAAGAGLLVGMSRNSWRIFQDSGWFVWLELLVTLLGLLVLAGLGLLVTLKPRAWSWPLVIPGVLVSLVAALGIQVSMGKVRGAIAGEAVDPSQKARIFAMGFSECLGLIIIGGLLASLLLSAASVVCSTRALARVQKRQLSGGALGSLGVGIFLLLAVFVVRLVVARGHVGPPFELLAAGSGILAVTIASSAMWGSPEEAEGHSRAAGDVLVAALLAAGGVLVASLSARGYSHAMAFSAIAGESVDPSQKARILAEGFLEAQASVLWGALFLVPVFGAALLPLAMRSGHALKGIGFAWGGLLGAVLGSALAVVMPRLQSDRIMNELPGMWRVDIQEGLTLVEAPADAMLDSVAGSVLCIGKERITLGKTELAATSTLDSRAGCEELADKIAKTISRYDDLLIAADADVSYGRLSCLAIAWADSGRVAAEARRPPLWVVKDSTRAGTPLPPPFDTMISGLGVAPAPDRYAPSGSVFRHLHVSPSRLTFVRSAGDEPTRKEGDPAALRQWLRSLLQPSNVLKVTAEPDLKASAILPLVADLPVVVFDAATTAEVPAELEAPKPGAGKGSLREGALTVNGRLAPEIIQRIVRQRAPWIRRCYEQGLGRNPDLQGRVLVRFVIDRQGNVSSVNTGGSDIPDAQLTHCVAAVFQGTQFPSPEGGIVTVAYPIVFTPGK